jgi:hypothetical protein
MSSIYGKWYYEKIVHIVLFRWDGNIFSIWPICVGNRCRKGRTTKSLFSHCGANKQRSYLRKNNKVRTVHTSTTVCTLSQCPPCFDPTLSVFCAPWFLRPPYLRFMYYVIPPSDPCRSHTGTLWFPPSLRPTYIAVTQERGVHGGRGAHDA